MGKSQRLLMLCIAIACISLKSFAQNLTAVSGTVLNSGTKESISSVSVLIKGSSAGAYTDDRGRFKFTTTQKPPFTLVISSVGYEIKEVQFNGEASVNIELAVSYALGEDVVVAASRVPQRILEAPVSIERVTANNIKYAPASSYYELLGNLKGVDMNTSSYTFKTPSTRGFNYSGNTRFNQFVDGMDNTAPALNFSLGNIIGLTELDVDNMELLPGASSALYGSGGLNGTLLVTSKDPFKYQGASFQIKQGVMHIGDSRHNASPFYDWSFRWGKKVSEKFAFKIGAQYVKADDWEADDSTNLLRNNVNSKIIPGTRATDPNYDGINVYGDEVSASLAGFAGIYQAQVRAGVLGATGGQFDPVAFLGNLPNNASYADIDNYIKTYMLGPLEPLQPTVAALAPFNFGLRNGIYFDGNQNQKYVSRTGYNEKALVDYNTYNFKISGGLYYKITNNIEASLTANWGKGTSVYTGADRYSIKNFVIGQYKLEVKSKNWFVRGYTTQENSGDSYAQTLTAIAINSSWKDNGTWLGQYVGTYSASSLWYGLSSDQATAAARAAAETGRLLPGTQGFNDAFNKSTTTSISKGGSQFADKSSLYEGEGQLNLSDYIKVLDVLVGANYRLYNLNSKGTIFADTAGPIKINEYGAYVQLQKQLFKDILKISLSGRVDKSMNYDARFTPRATASIKVAKNNNIRLSYQQAYRFPTNQDQYINIQTPASIQIGGLPSFAKFFNFAGNPVYTSESVGAYRAAGGISIPQNVALLKVAEFTPVQPESVRSFEIGYRGIIAKKLLVDLYIYTSKYKDFIARRAVARGNSNSPDTAIGYLSSPFTSTNYSFVVNSPTPVKENGWGLSLEYQLRKGYKIMGNVYTDKLKDVPDGLVTFFNTPKYRFNLGFANQNVYKGIGFNIMYKWQDDTYWEGTFGTASIPSYGTMDMLVSYKIGKSKNLLKLGATNLFNNYYRNAFGNPYIGGLYFVSFGYNVF